MFVVLSSALWRMGGSLRRLKKNRPKVRTGLRAKNRAGKKVKEAHLALPATGGRDGAAEGGRGGGAPADGGGADGDGAVDVRLGGSWEVKKSTIQNYGREGVTGDANAAVSAAARPAGSEGGEAPGDDDGQGAGEHEGEWGRRIRAATNDEIAVATGKARSTGKAPPRRLTVRSHSRASRAAAAAPSFSTVGWSWVVRARPDPSVRFSAPRTACRFVRQSMQMTIVRALIDAHGEDYVRMSRDLKLNKMQHTPTVLKVRDDTPGRRARGFRCRRLLSLVSAMSSESSD